MRFLKKLFSTTSFKTVTIGNQVWMAKNLNVDHYRNGDPIPEVSDPREWMGLTIGAWCYYDDDPVNGATYGKLYNWHAVNDPRGLAPQGWHIPNDAEWVALIDLLGGRNVAGGKMKERGTTHWSPNTSADNKSGFSALPGGYRNRDYGAYLGIGKNAVFWSSTVWGNIYVPCATYLGLYCDNSDARLYNDGSMQTGFSVRCFRD